MSINYAPVWRDPPTYVDRAQDPRAQLSVSDVERLAKAGVQINFDQIASQVTPDFIPPVPPSDDLTSAFWDRWWRNMHARNPNHFGGHMRPWTIAATDGKDKINIYVAPTDGSEPFILQDEKFLFPSDALFAALDLHEGTRGKA